MVIARSPHERRIIGGHRRRRKGEALERHYGFPQDALLFYNVHSDANDGLSGDNRYYQRHNVSRAWPSGSRYWFTGPDQHEDEPDPAGPQWVDYARPFDILGPGRYLIEAGYRWSATRASYPASYQIHQADGTNEVLRSQRLGSAGTTI